MGINPSFEVGDIVTHEQMRTEFGVSIAGGIRPSTKNKLIVLISDISSDLYDNKWQDDVLHYTGMGMRGDQDLSGSNLTLAESEAKGYELHFFEKHFTNRYKYRGIVELCGDPYTEKQLDADGKKRTVWMFPIKLVNKST